MKQNRKRQAGTAADSSKKDENIFVCQHNAKPNVVCSQMSSDDITIYQNGVLVVDKGVQTYALKSKSFEAIIGEQF